MGSAHGHKYCNSFDIRTLWETMRAPSAAPPPHADKAAQETHIATHLYADFEAEGGPGRKLMYRTGRPAWDGPNASVAVLYLL